MCNFCLELSSFIPVISNRITNTHTIHFASPPTIAKPDRFIEKIFLFFSLETRSALLSYEDWILDVRWFTQQNKCAFITSHNRVFIIDSIEGNILSCHASELNCILYPWLYLVRGPLEFYALFAYLHCIICGWAFDHCECSLMQLCRYSATLASIKPSGEIRQPSDILVLAGTVFNKVAVWRCKEDCVKKAIISHQLSGHNVGIKIPRFILLVYSEFVRNCFLLLHSFIIT